MKKNLSLQVVKYISMKTIEKTYKVKQCPFRRAMVNQGVAMCDKGKDPFKDCENCEFMKEVEVKATWASTEE